MFANPNWQHQVEAFFARPQAPEVSRGDYTLARDSEQLEELVDELVDDLGQPWCEVGKTGSGLSCERVESVT